MYPRMPPTIFTVPASTARLISPETEQDVAAVSAPSVPDAVIEKDTGPPFNAVNVQDQVCDAPEAIADGVIIVVSGLISLEPMMILRFGATPVRPLLPML